MVALAYAGAHPGAVMVMHFNASAAIATVKGSRGLDDIAGLANIQHYLLSIDHCVVS